jgi:hypothetical protein
MIPHTVAFSPNSTYVLKTDVGMISPSSPTFPSFLSNSEKKVIIIFGTTALYVPLLSLEVFIFFFGFPDTVIIRSGAVNPTFNPQPGGPGLRICGSRRQGDDPATPPAIGYSF